MIWENLTRQKSGAKGKKKEKVIHVMDIETYIYIYTSGLHENYIYMVPVIKMYQNKFHNYDLIDDSPQKLN